MAFEGDLTNLGLADIFQTLGMNRQSGTLVVKHEDAERRFYFTDDGVSLLTSRSARKFRLGNLLVGMGKLQESDLKVAVLKQERARETKLGDILVQTSLVKTEDIKEACRYQAAEEIYESFSWKTGKFQFLEGANAGPSGGPGPFAEFFFSVTDCVMEAARRADEFSLNLQKIGDLAEFWVRKGADTPSEEKHGRGAKLLHAMLDGTLDVSRVFEEFHLSAFDTSAAFVVLIDADLIAPMTPEQLHAAAKPFLASKAYDRAARLLARASHHAPKDTALLKELADTQAEGGDKKAAGKTLAALGRVHLQAQQRTEAIEALRKAVQQDSRLEEAYELLMEAHASLEQFDKAEDACREAGRLLSDDRNFDGALRLLDRGLASVPGSVNLRIQRANCLLAMGRKEDGLAELAGIAGSIEEGGTRDTKMLLSIYRKLQQLDPENAAYRGKVESLLAGEKAREARKRILKVASVVGIAAALAGAWFLMPKTAGTRLAELEARLGEHPKFSDAARTAFEEMAAEAEALLAKFDEGSEEGARVRQAKTQIDLRRTAPERAARVADLEKRIRDEVFKPAAEAMQREKPDYPGGIRRVVSAKEMMEGSAVAGLQVGEEFAGLKNRIQDEVRKALAFPADALRGVRKSVQDALGTVSSVDISKADDERQRQVCQVAFEALRAWDRADWKATVDALEEASKTLGGEDLRLNELHSILDELAASLPSLEESYHIARASVLYTEIRRAYTVTASAIRQAKQDGDVAKGIEVCDEFLSRCEILRKEEPRKFFEQVVDRLDALKLEPEIRGVRDAFDKVRSGLDRAKQAEAAGDLQGSFETLRKTIGQAQDINFQELVLLPLRVESRPEGATVTVTLPDGKPIEAGKTPVVIRYPYQRTTILQVELPGFEPAALRREGIEKDRDAVVTVELQRTLRWRREAGDPVEGRPGLAPGLVLVGTRGGLFRGLDAATGDERFQVKTEHLSGISGGILVEGSVAYFGGNDKEAFAVDFAKTPPAFLWRKKTVGPVSTMPALAGGLVVVGDSDGRVYAFKAATGDEAWRVELKSPVTADPVVQGDLAIFALADGRLVGLRAADGGTAWTARLAGPAAVLGLDGRGGVVAGTDATTLDRVDAASGDIAWSTKTDSPVHARPAMHGGSIVALSSQGLLHRFKPDGTPGGPPTSIGRAVEGGCSILGDTLYAAAEEGTLVAWDLKANRLLWALGGLGSLHAEPAVAPGILVSASASSAGAVVVLEP